MALIHARTTLIKIHATTGADINRSMQLTLVHLRFVESTAALGAIRVLPNAATGSQLILLAGAGIPPTSAAVPGIAARLQRRWRLRDRLDLIDRRRRRLRRLCRAAV